MPRERTDQGDYVDVSMLESMVDWMGAPLYLQMYRDEPPTRNGARHTMIAPYGPHATGDGAVVNIAVQTPGQWDRLCRVVLERPELATDERFHANERRVARREQLDQIVEEVFAGHTGSTALELLRAADIPCGAVRTLEDVVDHAQLAARDRWTTVSTPRGVVRALESPFNLRGVPRGGGRVPGLGEDTASVHAGGGVASRNDRRSRRRA